MNRIPQSAPRGDDAALPDPETGFTLVEVLLASFLSVVVLALAGWMLLTAFSGGRDVAGSTTSASQAQLVAVSVSGAVRTSTGLSLTSFAGTGQLLRATEGAFDAAGNATGWVCRAWAVTSDGRAYTARSAAAIPAPLAQAASAFDGWTLLASGLAPGRTPGQVITLTGQRVELSILATSTIADGAPALVATSVAAQPLTDTQLAGAPAC